MEKGENHFLSRQLKEDLENLERYTKEFSVFLPLAVCTVNPTGIIVDVNQAAKRLTGHDETKLIGLEIELIFTEQQLAKEFFRRVLKSKSVENQEMILVARGGKKIPVNVSASIRKDDQDNIIGCFWAIFDITEIKKFQESLEKKVKERTKEAEEEKNKTRAVLISLVNGLIVFDKDKKITLVNPEAEKILGLKEKEVLYKRIDQISGLANLEKLYQALGRKVEWTGQKYELVLDEPLKRFFQVSIAPVVFENKTAGLMIILYDITREREIDRMKTEFVSIAAHQLRTPLSAIKWILRMLLDGDIGQLSQEQAEFLEKGYRSNERMISLINDLLNVARIEEGRFLYSLTYQSLEEIIEKVIEGLSGLVKEKKLKLVFNKPKKTLPKVKVDKEKIELVVQNLLDNAIRFNNSGGQVTISVKCDKMKLEVMVQDTGVGIPRSQRKRIFAKFFRADNAIKLETEGTGLGLFICKNIIEAHGGKIWFESQEGQGTTFWFTLPTAQ
ncbi:MAG: hypothetical protein COS49_01545 [Candidatus Portnoybacteria bacterium CG03_land_8_20_14_0_80_41_10]|uniref:histidine kinase n=1 Tax=Candidatus Portnoybacteria bacterium CG03_land_8_20_14_0_80_41_10 TaxID=1974808 RepID=A0A2M7BUK1_9BACT|nr:MAG: hypothetical protein COS49_01545 [Candidatus Portnoybacteria bacterium CG03_land_8_20_14_0_80_41_10]